MARPIGSLAIPPTTVSMTPTAGTTASSTTGRGTSTVVSGTSTVVSGTSTVVSGTSTVVSGTSTVVSGTSGTPTAPSGAQTAAPTTAAVSAAITALFNHQPNTPPNTTKSSSAFSSSFSSSSSSSSSISSTGVRRPSKSKFLTFDELVKTMRHSEVIKPTVKPATPKTPSPTTSPTASPTSSSPIPSSNTTNLMNLISTNAASIANKAGSITSSQTSNTAFVVPSTSAVGSAVVVTATASAPPRICSYKGGICKKPAMDGITRLEEPYKHCWEHYKYCQANKDNSTKKKSKSALVRAIQNTNVPGSLNSVGNGAGNGAGNGERNRPMPDKKEKAVKAVKAVKKKLTAKMTVTRSASKSATLDFKAAKGIVAATKAATAFKASAFSPYVVPNAYSHSADSKFSDSNATIPVLSDEENAMPLAATRAKKINTNALVEANALVKASSAMASPGEASTDETSAVTPPTKRQRINHKGDSVAGFTEPTVPAVLVVQPQVAQPLVPQPLVPQPLVPQQPQPLVQLQPPSAPDGISDNVDVMLLINKLNRTLATMDADDAELKQYEKKIVEAKEEERQASESLNVLKRKLQDTLQEALENAEAKKAAKAEMLAKLAEQERRRDQAKEHSKYMQKLFSV